jgi:SPP1 gp7 family putative phage head morphogenesis protein
MSKNYWAERMAKNQARLTNINIKDTQKELVKYYEKTFQNTIVEFENTLLKIQKDSMYREPTPADLYKLDKYWQLQQRTARELDKLGKYEFKLFSKQFRKQYLDTYLGLALPADENFVIPSTENVQQMINQIWCADGKSWSDRVWNNTKLLQEELNEGLLNCVVSGKTTKELKDRLQERFDVSFSRADSIVRTEMAHIQTQAAQQRYKDAGIQYVQVWADYDERRCETCGALHEKLYPIGAQMPIPAHPKCRCTIIPVVE